MSNIEKLSLLYTAEKRLQAYNTGKRTAEQEMLADADGNGVVNSADRMAILNQIKIFQKELYSMDEDNEYDYKELFASGDLDLNGDGAISEEERTFLANVKNNASKKLSKKLKASSFTGIAVDGRYYAGGSLASGVFNGVKYVNGDAFNGVEDDIQYKDGKPLTGKLNGIQYKDGKPFTGALDGIQYKDGEPFTGTLDGVEYKDGKVVEKADDSSQSGSSSGADGSASGSQTGEAIKYGSNGKPFTGYDSKSKLRYVDGKLAQGKTKVVDAATNTFTYYYYKDGKKLTGIGDDGLCYKNGGKWTGEYEGKRYQQGKLYSGKYNGHTYVDGVKQD